MKKKLLIILYFFSSFSFAQYQLTKEDEEFLDTLQYYTFQYFIDQTNHENGLVRDRTQDWSAASIAATGWGVAAWAIGVEHDWITRDKASELTLNLLRFLYNSVQSTEPDATGFQGFYYHFLNMETGKREWNSELSTIDTAWLLAGIRFAVQYYDRDNEIEKEIRSLGDKLTNRVNWDWTIISEENSDNHEDLVSMGWKPEEGLFDFGWFGYTEALYLYILAAGTNLTNPEKAYEKWQSTYKWVETYDGLAHVIFPPLFGHQYSHMFIDFRNLADDYLKEKGIDYFENSRRATLSNRMYCIENVRNWKGYDSLTWGISACDGPGESYNTSEYKFRDYAGRGASNAEFTHYEDGTLTPTAPGGSFPFAPEVIIPTLKNLKEKYGKSGLWGKYGFKDSFNPTANWIATDYLGLDQGPILIMIENFRTGLIWEYSMKDPVIKKGLKILGFSELN